MSEDASPADRGPSGGEVRALGVAALEAARVRVGRTPTEVAELVRAALP